MAEMARERAICLPLVEETQVGAARRRTAALATALGFDETRTGRLSVIVTEAASNLVHHAKDGMLIVQPIRGHVGVDVIAVDRGPGMADPARCLQDGYSTAGTRGQGLGAIQRQSDEFDLDSKVGVGSVVVARVWRDGPPDDAAREGVKFGAICTPISGEEHVGDSWACARFGSAVATMVADGLGHGVDAESASHEAILTFLEAPEAPTTRILERSHEALRSGRGAAVAVARIEDNIVRFAGVGNVAGSVMDGTTVRHMVSHNGIVGHQMPRAQEFTYPWNDRSLLVMASDGIRPQWRLDGYPGIMRRHPTLIAATIWRDHSRQRDDATVVVAQGPGLR
jgi:anti-sigma regulatory factor (Ser/Thr protein kinase)